MRSILILFAVVLMFTACSKSEDESLGEEIANRMKAPTEKTQGITDKIQRTRAVELPE